MEEGLVATNVYCSQCTGSLVVTNAKDGGRQYLKCEDCNTIHPVTPGIAYTEPQVKEKLEKELEDEPQDDEDESILSRLTKKDK